MSAPLRTFYARYPYPPHESIDLRRGTLFGFLDYVRSVLWPRRRRLAGLRVLDAGCGTGETAVHMASRYPEVQVTAIDISPTSLEVARRLAADAGVGANLALHELAIEDVHQLNQRFDYVCASGVLHHLPDPVAGLRALAGVTASDGGLGLMLYAPYGRQPLVTLQELVRRAAGRQPLETQVSFARQLIRRLPETHPFQVDEWPDAGWEDDAGIADLLLNPIERSFAVPEVYDLLDAAGLRLHRFYWPRLYQPETYLPSPLDPRLRATFEALPPPERAAAAELLHGRLGKHLLFAMHERHETPETDQTPASQPPVLSGAELWRSRPLRSPLFDWSQPRPVIGPEGESALAVVELPIGDGVVEQRVLAFLPWQWELLQGCDGEHSAAQVWSRALAGARIATTPQRAQTSSALVATFFAEMREEGALLFTP